MTYKSARLQLNAVDGDPIVGRVGSYYGPFHPCVVEMVSQEGDDSQEQGWAELACEHAATGLVEWLTT